MLCNIRASLSDILVGDNVTLVSTANGVSKAEFAKRFAKWDKAVQEAAKDLENGDDNNQKARDRYRKLYEERTAFMNEDRTGYVWLFLRK